MIESAKMPYYDFSDAYTCRVDHAKDFEKDIDIEATIDLNLQQTYEDLCFKRALFVIGNHISNDLESLRLCTGILCNVIYQNMIERIQKGETENTNNKRRCHLYSVHDSTLMALLCCLYHGDVSTVFEIPTKYNYKWPPYGSWMSFELWKNALDQDSTSGNDDDSKFGNYYVKVIYNGDETPINNKIKIRLNDLKQYWIDIMRQG